jgi:hypothetical protein
MLEKLSTCRDLRQLEVPYLPDKSFHQEFHALESLLVTSLQDIRDVSMLKTRRLKKLNLRWEERHGTISADQERFLA